ncbi:TIGR03943 family putative permease subunit [Crocosphaera sp. XPORK-15E]|uniref:TIGR03943 family putative permease subunit n=1 Tax=Crocosphaera sp. XPORK-15E TaxID=3110247 RepID=UPI002B203DA7|nr:TIGR03943 family protein [Crocosphaera sp. XPORK-15E]MEA5536487.1 TIGR03943 family protein [Crocosphaera sp. XPORK-15E]
MNLLSRLKPSLKLKRLLPGLDVLAILIWGALLFKYWISGQLRLLIHPNYFWLVFITSILLVLLGIVKARLWLKDLQKKSNNGETVQHITLFPPGWGSSLLIITAVAGFIIPPVVFNSQVALQRGISESLPVTQAQTESFSANVKPEDRSLIDWIRTLNAYPEPDAYQGQKAKVTGFVVHSPILPENYIFLSRFILTCCAVDAYPVGLPVKLDRDRSNYPADTWLEIEGEMMTETLAIDSQTMQETPTEKRQLVLSADSITTIPTPDDPYGY